MKPKTSDEALAVYLSERADLVALARGVVGNPQTAEDLVQDSWLRWTKQRYPLDKARPILMRIVKNLSIDWLRRQQTERTALNELPNLIDHLPDTERVVIARQQLACAIRALQELPERTLAAFRMRRLEGLTYREIGHRLGTSEAGAFRLVGEALVHVVIAIDAA